MLATINAESHATIQVAHYEIGLVKRAASINPLKKANTQYRWILVNTHTTRYMVESKENNLDSAFSPSLA